MGSAAVEKTEEELRKEIDELQRQQREITERLRDPRGLRKGGLAAAGPRNFAANGARPRGFTRPADRPDEEQPPAKRRLSSAVVKVEDGEITEIAEEAKDGKKNDTNEEAKADQSDRKLSNSQQSGWSKRDGNHGAAKKDFEIPAPDHVPRVLPKEQDPSLVNRNKRMLGQLLGTLEKFRKEDMQLSGTEAFMRRSNSLQRAEQRAREESERLRQQEREQIAEKRRRDLTLRARVNAKTEEKRLELLFLQWSEHNKKLCNFIRLFLILVQKVSIFTFYWDKDKFLFMTKAEPPIYYLPKKPLDEDPTLAEQRKEKEFLEWKAARREELTEYQKQIGEQCIANAEKELERWQNARKPRKANNDVMNLQETMDKELDTHRLEHGPKKRKIPDGSNNDEDEDDVEDINVAEDYMIDDVLDVDDNSRRIDEIVKPEAVCHPTTTMVAFWTVQKEMGG
ncbi:protein-protein interaction regulator family protein [Prunus dulcis]|uniref:Protein-protein interaction regulator family protein n=1 Tax=Prunus dulcis TaxID=3755 RepID=A0A4Y1QW97_PRUDU|nr:protein-protein interaction regulator family protein [Prunus dulcis]